MAFVSNIRKITLDGTGTEIPTLSVLDTYDYYIIDGVATATGNYSINPTGTASQGLTFVFKYRATLSLGVHTFSIFGQSLTVNQCISKLDIECYYNGTVWTVEVKPSFISEVVETDNVLVDNITNSRLAEMSAYTLKANNTAGTANPTDVSMSTLFNSNVWSLTGNSGTTAGTNFIGTTDAKDLVFKVDSIESGRISFASGNTSFGIGSLLSISSGTGNSAFGNSSLGTASSGSNNSAFGNALSLLTTGSHNTGIGYGALPGVTSGSNNTGLGEQSGVNLTTGSNNTFIGYNAYTNSAPSLNRIALGANALPTSDYQFALPDDVTSIKWRGVTYTLPSALPSGTATLHCSAAGVLTWS